MITKDLPPLTKPLKNFALDGLARAGLTLADCVQFFAQHRTEKDLYYVKEAEKRYHADGELEVDSDAAVSRGDEEDPGGAYVSAWVWVPDEEG
jgi:hypothetical protein